MLENTITTKAGPNDLLPQVGPAMYRRAYEKGMGLSAYLELFEDPSEGYNDGLDAYGRLLKAAKVRTRGIPELGLPASTYGDFNKNDNTRALIPEWIVRLTREVQNGRPYSTRGVYQSGDGAVGSWERPYSEAANARWSSQVAPAIPLAEVIAITTPIDNDTYRAYYLTSDSSASSMTRVGEGAEVPRVKLVGGERAIDLYKFGRSLEATYEQLRRQRVDKIAMHIQRLAVQAEIDKLAKVIDVMVNGDGNSGTSATNYDLTTLDTAATAGNLTLKAWLAFKMKFANPYMATTALVNEGIALQMVMLNAGSANVPLVTIGGMSGFGSFTQINNGLADGVRLGWTSDAPSLKILAFDNRFAVERVTEVGADITEIERFTTRQTQVLTMTEIEGYAVIDAGAAKTLDVNA
jgi:hypothetical protein